MALELRRAFPGGPLLTSTFDPLLVARHDIGPVRATALQRTPQLARAHHYFLPFYDRAFRRLELAGGDVVISSSAMFAKSVRPPPGVPHVCYCHTPPRFLWDATGNILDELPKAWAVRAGVRAMTPWLRRVDRRAAERVTTFVANSEHVAARIGRVYGRRSAVVYPPVEVERYATAPRREAYLLSVARLYPYKRVDLAIAAANQLKLPLKIAGDGPDRGRLERLAGATVEFLGWVAEERKPQLFSGARALVAPQVEDFGIATVESLAAGTPVVGLDYGGTKEIVEDGVTGTLVTSQDVDALTEAIAGFDPRAFSPSALRASARRFSTERFRREIRRVVEQAIGH